MALLAQLGVALLALAAWYGASSVAAWRRLRHVPGPALASFSYAWAAAQLLGQRGEGYEALRRYGPVVRVGPRQVLVGDAEAYRRVNGARAAHPRDTWYYGSKIDADQDTTFSALAPGPHDRLKAKVAAAYGGRAGVRLEPGVDRLVARLVARLRADHLSTAGGDGENGEDGEDGDGARLRPLDLAQFIRYFTLDIIAEVGYGRAWGFLDGKDAEYKYTESIEALIPLVATAAELPALRNLFIFPLTRALFAPQRSDKTGFGKLLGIAADIIHKRYACGDKEGEDMIGGFMRHGMTEKEAVTESLIQITAGSDTTATVIRTTMLYIMTTPRVYQRLREEMRAAIAAGQVSSPITNEEAKKLPYLQAVIYEGIRMRPPAVYGFYKQLAHDEVLCGLRLPAGTAVGHNGPAMMRSEAVFGRDAQVFRPERLLEGGDEERRAERWRVIDLAFGHGRWMCAGRTLALIELNKVYFELFRVFDFQIIYPGRAWSEKSTTLWSQSEMWTRVTEASPMGGPQ